MWAPLAVLVAASCLVLAGWAALRTLHDEPVILRQLIAAGVVEALLVVQMVVAAVLVAGGARPAQGAVTFWGYLLTTLVILPAAAAWAFAERTRWSSVVLLVAALTGAFLEYRLLQVWGAA